jgi:hypothetical protein
MAAMNANQQAGGTPATLCDRAAQTPPSPLTRVPIAEQTMAIQVDRSPQACPGCSVGGHCWSEWCDETLSDAAMLRRRSCECGWCSCGAGDVAVLVLLPPAQRHGW